MRTVFISDAANFVRHWRADEIYSETWESLVQCMPGKSCVIRYVTMEAKWSPSWQSLWYPIKFHIMVKSSNWIGHLLKVIINSENLETCFRNLIIIHLIYCYLQNLAINAYFGLICFVSIYLWSRAQVWLDWLQLIAAISSWFSLFSHFCWLIPVHHRCLEFGSVKTACKRHTVSQTSFCVQRTRPLIT